MNRCLWVLLFATATALAQPAANADREAMQGDWRILAVFDDGVDKLADPKVRGSIVSIAGDRLEWKSGDGAKLFTAARTLRPADMKGLPPEIDLVTDDAGKKRTLPGRYVLEKNHLRLAVRIKDSPKAPDPRIKQVTGRPQFLAFVLERIASGQPVPSASKKKDEERIIGTWDVIAYFDDADDYTNRGRIVVITKDRLEWKANLQAKLAGVGAGYKLHPEKSPPWIDLLNTKGGNPPPPEDGFLPSIYRFLDDDTLSISWPESGWRKDTKPQDRVRPRHFISNGDINLWILRRK